MYVLLNYLKTTLRVLYRDRTYAVINVLGFSIAIACCLILGAYLYGELSFDRHHENSDRIHRVVHQISSEGSNEISPFTSRMLGPLLERDYLEVQDFTRLRPAFSLPMLLRSQDTAIYWEEAMIADENVFEMFSYDVLAGDPDNALFDSNSIAISESVARTYFDRVDVVGEMLDSPNGSFRISLVYADLPENSHLSHDILLPYRRYNPATADNPNAQEILWDPSVYTYALLPQNVDTNRFREMSAEFWQRYMAEQGRATGTTIEFFLEPLPSIHMESRTLGSSALANKYYFYTFAVIGIFILLIACINYINLASARAITRAKEVGIRKLVGASKRQLIAMFMSEAIFFAVVGLALGIGLAELLLNVSPVNELLDRSLSLATSLTPEVVGILVVAALLIGAITGLYPALFVVRTLPVQALSGSRSSSMETGLSRRGLILLQLTISLGVIAATLLMMNQMQFIQSYSMGFEKENKLVVRLQGADLIEQLPVIENELNQHPSILGSTIGLEIPGQMEDSLYQYNVEMENGEFGPQLFRGFRMGNGYLNTMGMQLVAGRQFESAVTTDAALPVMVNEETVRRLGWNEPIGKTLERGGRFLRVIGVIEDFNFQDLRVGLEPLLISHDEPDFSNWPQNERPLAFRWLFVSYVEGELEETIQFLNGLFADLDPLQPFQYELLEDSLDEVYGSQTNQLKLVASFAVICIFISCLGLLGLSAFTTQQRTKEIGIRKVLGATVTQIILLLYRNIFSLIVVAGLAGSLLSYLAIVEWLRSFAYQAAIDPLAFVLSTLIVLLVAFMTIASQSYRTAQANPIEALRYE